MMISSRRFRLAVFCLLLSGSVMVVALRQGQGRVRAAQNPSHAQIAGQNPSHTQITEQISPPPRRGTSQPATPNGPAATITVNSLADGTPANNGQCTLREALLNANANDQSGSTDCTAGSGADVITISVNGTINLTGALPDISQSLTITGPGASLLTVRRDTGGDYRIFNITGGVVQLNQLTITNGATPSGLSGGGIRVTSLGTAALSDCVVTGNAASNFGGGIVSSGSLTINNSLISGNNADFGGGVVAVGSLTMTNSTVSDNTAVFEGGGLNLQSVTATLTNVTVSGNSAGTFAGGIMNIAFSDSSSSLTLTHCTVADNQNEDKVGGIATSDAGGAVSVVTTLRNTLVANNLGPNLLQEGFNATVTSQGFNLTSDGGGGLLAQPTDLINVNPLIGPLQNNGGQTPTHALFLGSPALDKGHSSGAATDQRGLPRPVDLPGLPAAAGGDSADIGAFEAQNLPPIGIFINDVAVVEGNAGTHTATFTATLSAASAQTVTVLYATANGTATAGSDYVAASGTLTFNPGVTSQPINITINGDTVPEPLETFFVNLSNPTNAVLGDAQGLGTIRNDEPFLVTNANDEGAGSLRQAMLDANANQLASTIQFEPVFFSTARTINLASKLPPIEVSLTINGPGANLLTVRRDTGDTYRIFEIVPQGLNIAFSGMTISGGRYGGHGVGIFSLSNLTLTNVHVTDNQAGFNGGGVYLVFANGVFTNCTFSNNTAGFYGGAINYAGLDGQTLRIVNSTISGNSATSGAGGIRIVNAEDNGNNRLELIGCTIVNNTAPVGGGIQATSRAEATGTVTTTLRNTIIANNTPTNLAVQIDGSGTATILSQGFNLTSDGGNGFLNQPTDLINANPLLGPLQNNGGPTPTHALLLGSPALDKGHSSGAATDQRGLPRPVDLPGLPAAAGGDGADIGAFEAQSLPPIGIFINDVTVAEGNIGTRTATFTVTLSAASAQTVTVLYATANGTATAGSDYDFVSGLLTFAPGVTSLPINVAIYGDTVVEPSETFFVNLTSPTNALLGDGQGVGTIQNDEVFLVTNANDDGAGSLRQAMQGANDIPGADTIAFEPVFFSTARTINLAGPLPPIFDHLTINGPGANLLTVRRDSDGDYPIFIIFESGTTATLSGLTITNGTGFHGEGGGIYNEGVLTVINCQISGNTADYGGGIRNIGTLTVIGSTITGNTAYASDSSGGIDHGSTTPLTLLNTTISGNTSLGEDGTNGGGIWTAGPTTITNCTITNNSVVGPNSAGGIRRYSGTTTIRNSIIAANQNSSTVPDLTAVGNIGFASSGYNLIGNVGAFGGAFNQTGDQKGTGAAPLNPVLASLGNYGGPTLTHLLLAGSPARNAGTSTGAPTTDQRGYERPVGKGVDIGAVENDVTLTITPATLPNGQMGRPYSQQLAQTGGATGTITWTASSGVLPPGNLTLNSSTGLLSGTPTGSGTFNFTVIVTSQNGLAGVKSYSLVIGACPTITVTPASLPALTAFTFFSQQLAASGGAPSYNFTVSAGTLPSGLTLSSSGMLSGAPTVSGAYNFTVRATDANSCTGERQYSGTIATYPGLVFYPLPSPVRLLETRAGFSGCNTPGQPINANGTLTLPAQGTCSGIPSGAAAVTGNITVVPSGPGFLTLFSSSAAQPTVANSNFGAGEITNNVFTVALGAGDGAFKIFASATTHVIVDVTGYYAPPAAGGLYFHPLATPVRLLETRTGFNGCFAPGAQLIGTGNPNADPSLDLALQGRSPIPSPCNSIPATAQVLVGNAISVLPSGGGYLTTYPSGGTRPTVASSNYAGSDVINGPFAVKLGADGKFKVYTFATTHLVIDILGYYSEDANDANGAGLFFNPLPSPVRLLETRPDFPGFPLTGCTRTNAPIQGNLAAATHTQMAANFCGLPASAQAVVGNVTVVNSTGAGFLTLFPANLTTVPLVATSNYPAPATFGYNRHYVVGLSPTDGKFKVLTQRTTDLILDASGYFAP